MADQKISALAALTGAQVDTAADVFAIVDTSAATTKKILVDELRLALSATQALQEAGTNTSTFVMPSLQQSHPSAAKAWASFDGTAANPITADAKYNVTGTITKNGTGDYTVTFTVPFSSTAYAILGMPMSTITAAALMRQVSKAAGSFRFVTCDTTGIAGDFQTVNIFFFGDQ